MIKKNNKTSDSKFMYIVYSNTHPSIRKMGEFFSNVAKDYFNVKVYEILPTQRFSYIEESIKLLFMIIRNKVNIVLLIEPWYPIFLLFLLSHHKIKIVYWSGNINFDVFKTLKFNVFLSGFLKIIEIILIKKCTTIMSDSESMISFFSIYNKSGDIYYVPEYVGNARDKPKIYTTEKTFVVGYISTIHIENIGNKIYPRGWELIEICRQLIKRGDNNIKFLVIGDGSGLSKLKNMVSEYGIDEYFNFTGFIDDKKKAELMENMDLGFCEDYKSFTTHRFNLSSKIEEYLRSGIPVVSGNQGDKKTVLCNDGNPCGICVKPLEDNESMDFQRYIDDLVCAIIYLKSNLDVLSNMSRNCLVQFNKRFSEQNIKTSIEKAFRKLF